MFGQSKHTGVVRCFDNEIALINGRLHQMCAERGDGGGSLTGMIAPEIVLDDFLDTDETTIGSGQRGVEDPRSGETVVGTDVSVNACGWVIHRRSRSNPTWGAKPKET